MIPKASSFLVKNICDRKLCNLEILSKNKYGFVGNFLKARNEVMTFSIGGVKEKFETKAILSSVDRALKDSCKTEWSREEKISILSSEINKTIDAACEIHGRILNEKEKDDLFRRISSKFGSVELDLKCTQSSISQILYNNKSLSEKVERLSVFSPSRDDKNKLRNIINTKLTDHVFMKKFGDIDLNILRKKTAEELARLIKQKKM
ncbi:MAG: hypothetical protein ACRCZ6_18645 [Kluyvera sp.]|uniref:hypothetical protein n=1 Tax=Kluyvera sp. TaxID=1538228 RepID=UPI003F37E584